MTELREKDRSASRWDALATGNPPVLQFWYRESPRPLVSLLPGGKVYGEARPRRQRHGGRHLRHGGPPPALLRRPAAARGDAAAPPAPDWSPLFAEARLDPTTLRAVAPRWVPPFYADARAAWEGPWPGRPDITVRVEAASHRGKPVSFEVVWPWTRPDRMEKYAWPTGKLFRQAHLDHPLPAPRRRGRLHGPPQHRPRARGSAGGLPGRAAARGGRHALLGARGAPRGRLERADRASSRAGRASSSSRPRSSGSSTSRSSRTRVGCARGRSCPGRASSGAGSATRWWAATRSSASPGPWLAFFLIPLPQALHRVARPAAARPDGWLPGPAARSGPAARFRARSRERARSCSPWGRCCSSSSPGSCCGGTPSPPRRSSWSCSRRAQPGAAQARGSRWSVSAVWEVSWILLLLRFGLLAATVGLFAHELLVSFPLTDRPLVVDGRAHARRPAVRGDPGRDGACAAPSAAPACAATWRARRPRGRGRTPRGWSGRRAPRDRPPRGAARRSPRPRAGPRPPLRRRRAP